MRQNAWGENILGEYVSKLTIGGDWSLEEHWQVLELRDKDYDRTHYGREFELRKTTSSGNHSWTAGRFSRKELTGLRDMLNEVLGQEELK